MITGLLSAAVLMAIWLECTAYKIEGDYLKGVAANTGIGNVLPLSSDLFVTTANATCIDLKSCPSCPGNNWIWIPESNAFKCVCQFGSYFINADCYASNVTGCTETKSRTECGLTKEDATQFMKGAIGAFNVAVPQSLMGYLRPVDLLDTLLRFQTFFQRPLGMSAWELGESLSWMKTVLVSTPDNLLAAGIKDYELLQRIKMSVGFWQFPKVAWRGQDIFINSQNMTSEMNALIKGLYEHSWYDLGYTIAKFIAKVPSDFNLTLSVDSNCPKTWWTCMNYTYIMGYFLQGVLEGMNLNNYAKQNLTKIIDLDDIDYLYLFYNKAMAINLNGGYDPKEAQDSIANLFNAIKRLTDENFDEKSVNGDISKFQLIIELFSTPKVSVHKKSFYINGIDIWGDFSKVYLALEQGYYDNAGFSAGKILLAICTPLVPYTPIDAGNSTDDPQLNTLAELYFARLTTAFTNPNSTSEERRRLGATINSQCVKESLDFSKRAVLALQSGGWISAVVASVKVICQALDAAGSCQDSFEAPDEIDLLCNLFEGENIISSLFDIGEYIFKIKGVNFFNKMVVAANSALNAAKKEVNELISDVGDEISDVLTGIWDVLKSGRVLSAVFIFIVVSVN